MTNQTPSPEVDREEFIRYCGKCFEEAVASGDRGMAYFWLEAQNAQIRLRTPEKVAELEAERGLA